MNRVIDTATLSRLLESVRDARIQAHTGFVPAPGEPEGFDVRGEPLAKRGSYKENVEDNNYSGSRSVGRFLLFITTEKLRRLLFEIGRSVALDPADGRKTQIDEGTFDKLFGDLGFELLRTPAAVEGFRKGIESASV
jgi:hypothetical protein